MEILKYGKLAKMCKTVTCWNCGSVMRVTIDDVKRNQYAVADDGSLIYFFNCPVCNRVIEVDGFDEEYEGDNE